MHLNGEFIEGKPKKLSKISHANFVSWLIQDVPRLEIYHLDVHAYQTASHPDQAEEVISYLNNTTKLITDYELHVLSEDEIFAKLPKNKKIYLSIDVDVLQTALMPSTGFPVATGISLSKFWIMLNYILNNNIIRGVDIMEYKEEDSNKMRLATSQLIITMINFILEKIANQI
ncbi:formimidoylglutamase [Rickettsiales bacterium Ac37b]|nr:formimidoylglutamase [Rickettsiales bacterium Ac37b]